MTAWNKLGALLLAGSLVAPATFRARGNGPELGRPAPPLTLSTILQAPENARADWVALRGKVVLIDFWATWCGPCRKAFPHWNALVEGLKDKPVQFLAISDENEQVVSAFLKRTPIHGWVGMDGVGQSMRDRYGIEGIPTTIIVNQQGIVVAVTHPAGIQLKDIEEVLATGKSSLRPPSPSAGSPGLQADTFERVPSRQSVYEVSARPSGPLPPGHGVDCWSGSATSADATGEYASVQQAILTLFRGKPSLLEIRTALPAEKYDFTVRLPTGTSQAARERAVEPLFRSAFGLQIRRVRTERDVYVLKLGSTNGPGLTLSGPHSTGFGSSQPGGFQLSRSTLDSLPTFLEQVLGVPVVNDVASTNCYDIRLKWKMSKAELLPQTTDRQVLASLDQPDAAKEQKLSLNQRRLLAAVRGQIPDAEVQRILAEQGENIQLLRAELAKPEAQRFLPEAESIRSAVREQLGLKLSLERRSVPILIVEKAEVAP